LNLDSLRSAITSARKLATALLGTKFGTHTQFCDASVCACSRVKAGTVKLPMLPPAEHRVIDPALRLFEAHGRGARKAPAGANAKQTSARISLTTTTDY
jgi:hypothetical protein